MKAIGENTSCTCAFVTEGKGGKALGDRWVDRVLEREAPQSPAETRTQEEVVRDIREKIKALPPG